MVDDRAMVISSFPDVAVRDVGASVDFYRGLLGLAVIVDHGWYAELGVGGTRMIAFVQRGHETTPAAMNAPPAGVLLSFVVRDAGEVATDVERLGCPVVWPLASELGQRHLMIADPDG